MNDTMKRLRNYRVILAVSLLLIPIILRLSAGEWRKSISDYAYADNESLLPMLLGIASGVFVLDAVINRNKWYNSVLGASLMIVGVTPHLDYQVLHYTSAGVFFIGSMIAMVSFSSREQRKYMVMLCILSIVSFSMAIILDAFSILIAEWIALVPICAIYVGEAFGAVD